MKKISAKNKTKLIPLRNIKIKNKLKITKKK